MHICFLPTTSNQVAEARKDEAIFDNALKILLPNVANSISTKIISFFLNPKLICMSTNSFKF